MAIRNLAEFSIAAGHVEKESPARTRVEQQDKLAVIDPNPSGIAKNLPIAGPGPHTSEDSHGSFRFIEFLGIGPRFSGTDQNGTNNCTDIRPYTIYITRHSMYPHARGLPSRIIAPRNDQGNHDRDDCKKEQRRSEDQSFPSRIAKEQ